MPEPMDDDGDQARSSRTAKSAPKAALKPKRKSRAKKDRVRNSKSSTPSNVASNSTSRLPSETAMSKAPQTHNPEGEGNGDGEDDVAEESHPNKPRRGNQGNFSGPRLQFLCNSLPEYTKAKSKNTCMSRICKEWFDRWPWHDQDEQPEKFNPLDAEDDSLSEEARAELEADRKQVQAAVQIAGKAQISRWFWRRVKKAAKTAPIQQTPLAPVLRKALGFAGGAPRRSLLYKVWMKRPENQIKVRQEVDARVAVNPVKRADLLNFRCQVAEELFKEEPDEVKKEVEEFVEEVYQQKLEFFTRVTSGEPVSLEELNEDRIDDSVREVCREALTKFLQPLLDILRLYTGLNFCLLGGAAPANDDEDYFLITINSGTSGGLNPQTFERWNEEYFMKNVMSLFMLFLSDKDPKELLGEPGLIHPEGVNRSSKSTSPLNDDSLIRMPSEDGIDTQTRRKSKRLRKKAKGKAKGKDKHEEEEDKEESGKEGSEEEEEVFRDENGKVVDLRKLRGKFVETRDDDVVMAHFYAESTPEPEGPPLPDDLKAYLSSMLTPARRDSIGMLNSQSGRVRQHNLDVLMEHAEVWKAQQVQLPKPRSPPRSPPHSPPPHSPPPHSPPHSSHSPPHSSHSPHIPSINSKSIRSGSEPRTSAVIASKPPIRSGSLPIQFNCTTVPELQRLSMDTTSATPTDSGKGHPISTDSMPNTNVHQNSSLTPNAPSGNGPLSSHTNSSPPPSADGVVAQGNELTDGTGNNSTGSTQDSVTLADCPAWLSRAVEVFGGLEQQSTEWRKALEGLVILERTYLFEDPSGRKASFPTAKDVRPRLVEWYFKNRKNVQATLNNDFNGLTVESLGRDLRKWWSVINPAWRERDAEWHIVPQGQGEGSWDGIHRPGQCGMVTVLLCLRWWFLRVSDDEEQTSQVLLLLSDVRAAIEDMAYEKGGYDRRIKRKAPPSSTTSTERPTRRARLG
ncbi:hypothetical protein C8R42DRAFT_725421 [Lentinula raphanica]|nr:hypothetical protein C8R42DRAFT_725421 [Lentinula raphanica]